MGQRPPDIAAATKPPDLDADGKPVAAQHDNPPLAQPSIGGFLRNAASDAPGAAVDFAMAVPRLAKTLVTTGPRQVGKDFLDGISAQYGGVDQALQTAYNKPVHTAVDVASLLSLTHAAGKGSAAAIERMKMPDVKGDMGGFMPKPDMDRYLPNKSGWTPENASEPALRAARQPADTSASHIATPPQGTFQQLPDGTWGVVGANLEPNASAHVMTKAGAGRMVKLGDVTQLGNGQRRGVIADETGSIAAGLVPELISAGGGYLAGKAGVPSGLAKVAIKSGGPVLRAGSAAALRAALAAQLMERTRQQQGMFGAQP